MKLPKIVFTKEGLEEKKNVLIKLQNKRPHAVEQLKKAREMGDLSENGFYKTARAHLSQIDREIRQIQYLVRFAHVEEATSTDSISVGRTIVLFDGKQQCTYTLVGEHEANPLEGKISHKSPIGSALYNKKINETVRIVTPSNTITYTIIKII